MTDLEKVKKIGLIVISNRKLCKGENLREQIEKVFSDYKDKKILKNFKILNLTLRENDLSAEKYLKLFEEMYPICKKYEIKLNIHEKWDIFLEDKYKINGIHLKFETFEKINISIQKRKEFNKKYKNIGVSVHSLKEAKRAETLGATYLIVGHIFQTDCKKDLEPRGLDFLKAITTKASIPVFAIGGIDEENSNLAIENGAFGVCMMSRLMK